MSKKILVYFTISLLFISQLLSQQIDSDNITYEDSLQLTNPAYLLYENFWDNEFVKNKALYSSDLSDTVLYLNKCEYISPIKGRFLSPYGPRGRRNHAGIDIKLNKGDSVKCAFNGKVRVAKSIGGYGNVVVVRHYNGLETVYAHLSKIIVKPNDLINAGEIVGLGGRTGRATTEHLHFEIRYLTKSLNPALVINTENYELTSDSLYISDNKFYSKYESIKNDKKVKQITIVDDDILAEKYHVITKGDTLYTISKRNNVSISDLCELNNISKNKILKIGTKLRVQ